jgi:hypothetical protein
MPSTPGWIGLGIGEIKVDEGKHGLLAAREQRCHQANKRELVREI